jgi:hypothetical protein
MDWKIIIHNNPDYVEVTTNGIADKDGSLGMAKAITAVMRQNRINKALIDHRNIESITGEILDIYERPRIMKIIGAILRIRIAEIIKPDQIEHFRFLETVFRNQGFMFQIFHEREKAEKWLLE